MVARLLKKKKEIIKYEVHWKKMLLLIKGEKKICEGWLESKLLIRSTYEKKNIFERAVRKRYTSKMKTI